MWETQGFPFNSFPAAPPTPLLQMFLQWGDFVIGNIESTLRRPPPPRSSQTLGAPWRRGSRVYACSLKVKRMERRLPIRPYAMGGTVA